MDVPRNFEMWVRDFLGNIRFGFVTSEKWFANHESRALNSDPEVYIVYFVDKYYIWQVYSFKTLLIFRSLQRSIKLHKNMTLLKLKYMINLSWQTFLNNLLRQFKLMKHICLHDQFKFMLKQLNSLNNEKFYFNIFCTWQCQVLTIASQKYNRKRSMKKVWRVEPVQLFKKFEKWKLMIKKTSIIAVYMINLFLINLNWSCILAFRQKISE